MKITIVLSIASFLLLLFPTASFATPFLHDPFPSNNSYTKGGTIVLAINVTDATLNVNSVVVKIIESGAYQQGDEWVTQNLLCTGGTNEWKCSINFITSTIGSDTIELFYFEANDTNNAKGDNGTASSPLRFTLDRNPPVISFVTPVNNSFVSGNKTISLTVVDTTSGVNNNSVRFSIDNSTWATMNNVSLTAFESVWNTTVFSNNQSIDLYARASDNMNNNATTRILVTVDNEIPQLIVVSSLNGTLTGNVQLQVNASDNYSGLDLGNVRYSVGGLTGTLGCTGSNYTATCSAVLNTVGLSDGNHTLVFTVGDKAGNSNSSSMQINTINTQPSIFMAEPSNSAFVKGSVLVKASLAKTEGIVKYVEISIEQGANVTTKNMTCTLNLTSCTYSLDTNAFSDGSSILKARVINVLGSDISSSITVTIDNTKPSLTITHPTGSVKGDFEIKADVIDTNLNQNKIKFGISSFGGNLTCTPQTPSRFVCSTTFNSKQLNDGKYNLTVSAEDKAGNLAATSKEITVANQAPSEVQQSTSGATESGESASETENKTLEKKPQESFLGISLPFKTEFIILGIVVTAVIVIVAILVIVVRRRGKPIITD